MASELDGCIETRSGRWWFTKRCARPLPAGMGIVPHVLLEGAGQRSTDFLVAGTETLRPAVERICGRTLPRRRVPNGSYATQEGLASILQPLCAELGRFPNRAEVTAAGLSPAVWAMVSTRHGVRAMAAFMGVPYAGPRRREG